MADLGSIAALKADIDAKVTTNGANENTGARVNTSLNNMVDTLYAVGSPIPVGKMIYVDSVYGDDATGLVGRFDKPYETPAAAITAASAGDAVKVRPGTYVGNVVLKNGVNIITEPGVSFTKVADVINDYVFSDGGVAVTCSLTGNPKITLTEGASAAGGCIKLSHPSTNIYVELGDLIGDTTDTDLCILVEAGYIHGRIESCRSTTYDNIWVATNDSRADLDIGVSFSGDHNIEVTAGVANISIMEATGGGVNLVTSNGDTTNVCIRIQRMNLTNGPCTFGTVNGGVIIGSVSLGACDAGGTSAIAGVPVGLTICDTRFYNAVDPIVLFYGTGYVSDGGRISNCYIDGTGYGISVPVSGTIHVISSETTIPVGANVTVEGDLFYDQGGPSVGEVPTANADGSWSWA